VDVVRLQSVLDRFGKMAEERGIELFALNPNTLGAEKFDAELDRLSDRERRVVEMRHGLSGDAPRTLTEIGGFLSLSRERVRQIEKEAVRRLRLAAEQERAVA